MRLKTFLIAFIFGLLNLNGQSLLKNGSFELLSDNYNRKYSGSIAEAVPWYAPTLGSPDIIKSQVGKMIAAAQGRNYAGIVVYDEDNENFREYIQIKLNDYLEVDKRYIIQFSVALSEGSYFASNGLQLHLGYDSLLANHWNLLEAETVIPLSSNLLNNTKEWRQFTLEYKAKGGERFFTMGNFLTDAQTLKQKISANQSMKVCYMLIDDIQIIESKVFDKEQEIVTAASSIAVSNNLDYGMSRILIPHLLTPNNDGFNDIFFIPDLPIYTKLNIYDKKGILVFSSMNYKNDWSAEGLAAGIYYYEFFLPDGNIVNGAVDVVIK